jgi:hypothetical protein
LERSKAVWRRLVAPSGASSGRRRALGLPASVDRPYGSMPPLKQDFRDSGRRGLHGPSAEARSPHRPEVSPPPERGGDGQAASCGLGKRAAGKRREPTTTCDLRCGFGPAHHLVGVGLLSPRFAQVRRPYWTAPRQSFETLLWPQPRRSCGPPSGIALRAAEDAPYSLCQAWILGTRLARWWGIYLGGELRLPGSIKTNRALLSGSPAMDREMMALTQPRSSSTFTTAERAAAPAVEHTPRTA